MARRKQVLLITTRFPPQDFVGVHRAFRLAKYLPRFGWKPHVLTLDVNYHRPENLTLIPQLPDTVEIHRARYIEPTLRGVQMALGGRDRTLAALQREAQAGPIEAVVPAVKERVQRVGSISTLYGYLRTRWLDNPDVYNPWYGPALRKARQLVEENGIELVWTSFPDYTSQRIGLALQRDGLKWCLDFQDPALYMHSMHASREAVFMRQRRLESDAVRRADAISVTAKGIGMILTDMHGPAVIKDFDFIPMGIDEDIFESFQASTTFPYPYLLFPGSVLPEYGTSFLEAFAEALLDDAVRATGIRVVIVGNLEENGPTVVPLARRLAIEDRIVLKDHVPQAEVLKLLDGALAGVLLSGHAARWWCLHAKAVEYMGMRKRVVAVVPEISESRYHLEKTRLGVFLDGDREQAARTLADFILGRSPLPEIDEAECDRFTATRQAESFAALFARVLGS